MSAHTCNGIDPTSVEACGACAEEAVHPELSALGLWDEGEIIYAYTRAQALEDGTLVDVSEVAREAGFSIPAAMTRAAWASYVEVPEGVLLQDEAGRLWDVLWMAAAEARRPRSASLSRISFQLHVRNDNSSRMPPLVTLALVCGPADDGSPCLTIMLPEED